MRILRLLVIATLALLLSLPAARAFEIPAFTPNVVDPNDLLDDADTQMVNAELLRIREESGIWGAVFIVDTLGEEAIESVAVSAFEHWQLGQKGVDNGLLLVLAMTDRKSRFEVGYGLEGSITDVAARHALDAWLAPRMQQGDTVGAIVDAFAFLSRIVAQDPAAARELLAAEGTAEDDFDWNRGLIAWGVLVFALWTTLPIRNRWVARRRARLQRRDPSLSLDHDGILRNERAATPLTGGVLIKAFLTINPGVFVVMLGGWFVEGLIAVVAVVGLVMLLVILLPARRYASPERYRRHLEKLDRQRQRLIDAGHVEETAPGVYAYTAAYHASQAAASSSSSGFSSSSSSSSSSGGGRSGGGGASSGW